MQRRRLAVLVLAVLTLLPAFGASPVRGQVATPVAGAVLPPDATVAGLGLGEWHARWWQWAASLWLAELDPYEDATGARCGYGQHGPVFFLTDAEAPKTVERSCTVPGGVVLFVPIMMRECDTVTPDPELPNPSSADEAALRACAQTHIDVGLDADLAMAALEVDGQPVDVAAYRAPTPLFQVVWPANNTAGVPAGAAWAVADGFVALIGPLPAGEHVIETAVPNGAGAVARVTYRVTVASDDAPTAP
jgi:hypothetical protein